MRNTEKIKPVVRVSIATLHFLPPQNWYRTYHQILHTRHLDPKKTACFPVHNRQDVDSFFIPDKGKHFIQFSSLYLF